MQITESNKQEAENVYWYYGKCLGIQMEYKEAIKCAIQDRQSVLEENESVLQMLKIHGDLRVILPISERITNLTEQINYLKSKL